MLLIDEAVGMIDGVVAQLGATLTSFVGYSTGRRDLTAVNQRISQFCSNYDKYAPIVRPVIRYH